MLDAYSVVDASATMEDEDNFVELPGPSQEHSYSRKRGIVQTDLTGQQLDDLSQANAALRKEMHRKNATIKGLRKRLSCKQFTPTKKCKEALVRTYLSKDFTPAQVRCTNV